MTVPTAASANPFETLLGEQGRISLSNLIEGFAEASLTIATAESLTGGLLAAALTSVPGSSAVVRGGLVVYATDLKHTLAMVDARLLDEYGPVHPAVAAALADGARDRCGAAVGVGLTGVAGPDPQDGKPPGTWYVAVAAPTGRLTASGATAPDAAGSGATPARAVTDELVTVRHQIRIAAVRAGVDLLGQLLTPAEHGADTAGPDREHSREAQR